MTSDTDKKPFETAEELDKMGDITQQHLIAKILGKEDIARNTRIKVSPFAWAALENMVYYNMPSKKKKELLRHLDAEEDLIETDDFFGSLAMEFLLSYKNAAISEGGAGRTEFVAGAISAIQETQQRLNHQRHLDTLIGV